MALQLACATRWLKAIFRGGEGGIRTHGTVSGTMVFKTITFNHSVTSPEKLNLPAPLGG